ncbi:MAG: site-specific DNA-methyltransferase [Verrucomicrobia bacterium]|nr:site-specific DNA-methyltransferase [Verrucomicrobiota bacterium]
MQQREHHTLYSDQTGKVSALANHSTHPVQEWGGELWELLPEELRSIENPQTAIPAIAKDARLMSLIENAVRSIPTVHRLLLRDARSLGDLRPNSIHLVLTSPPYWTLKEYRHSEGQLGHIQNYEEFLAELDRVWSHCLNALVPGGRLICVVGDVCLSRRKNNGRHTVVPLHASIQEHCRRLGFDNLSPIIWSKIANAAYEVDNGGAGFLGKPYEPNAVIKNDIEFILMQRKPGGYRNPSLAKRLLSVISVGDYQRWFQQVWTGLTGASTSEHPAPYPVELAQRLIRMFSFVGDTVLDPFMGTGTTSVAAARCGRNSIGCEVDPHYFKMAEHRIRDETTGLFSAVNIQVQEDAQS